jgi:deoxyadenosine/deoxycytidine kinase
MGVFRSGPIFVLINGPFGIGKTTSARLVVERFPNSMLFDPEEIGAFLRRLLGNLVAASDYQDLELWRRDYFDEIVAGWRASGATVHCVRLTASRETLKDRIFTRSEEEGGHDWARSHLNGSLVAAQDPAFGREASTEEKAAQAVASEILSLIQPR